MKKRIFSIFISLSLIFIICFPASAFEPTEFEVGANAVVLVNADTDIMLYSKNMNEKVYPASLTKLMTALILYENTTDLDHETITLSKKAITLLNGTGSKMSGLSAGEVLTVRQTLNILIIYSANDLANAIAESIAETNIGFAELMNNKAAQLGMTNTHFVNPHGLHDNEHYTTAYDLYLLTKEYLSVPVLKEICFTTRYTLSPTNLSTKSRIFTTTNNLLNSNTSHYYKYAHGVKTGYTDGAGYCCISTASKNGYEYICVVLGCPVYDQNGKKIPRGAEFETPKQLYEWAFNKFEYRAVVNSDEIISEALVNYSSDKDHVALKPAENYSTIMPKVTDNSTVDIKVTLNETSFDAPISKGDVLGYAEIKFAGETIGTVDLVAAENVEKSFFIYAIHSVKSFFSKVFHSPIFYTILALFFIGIIVFVVACMIMNRNRKYTFRKSKKK